MSTASLRRDHELIEKVIKAMDATISLLNEGKQIPESIKPKVNHIIDIGDLSGTPSTLIINGKEIKR